MHRQISIETQQKCHADSLDPLSARHPHFISDECAGYSQVNVGTLSHCRFETQCLQEAHEVVGSFGPLALAGTHSHSSCLHMHTLSIYLRMHPHFIYLDMHLTLCMQISASTATTGSADPVLVYEETSDDDAEEGEDADEDEEDDDEDEEEGNEDDDEEEDNATADMDAEDDDDDEVESMDDD
jgi:hypothetical protein